MIAYPQAGLKAKVFIEIPWGFQVEEEENSSTFYLELLTNWYKLKDGKLNWFDYLKNGLMRRGFSQSEIDLYLFMRSSLVMVVYVNDIIITAKKRKDIEMLLYLLKHSTSIDSKQEIPTLKKFDFTNDELIKTFLGVNVEETTDSFHLF